jgi:hypothetical protein
MGRGVRTVQRWEGLLESPVHRIGKGKRSPVYAYATELNFWRTMGGYCRNLKRAVPRNGRTLHLSDGKQSPGKPVERSRRLLQGMHTLVLTVAEISVRQRQQTEALQKRLLEIRSRLKGNSEASS